MGNHQFISVLIFRSFGSFPKGLNLVRWNLFTILLIMLIPGRGFAQQVGLFDSEEILKITLTGELKNLFKDRNDEPEYSPVQLTYTETTGEKINIPLKVKQRGNFRRLKENCSFPPLMLNFADKNTTQTIFNGQDKLKLVMPCRGDEYVLQEFYAYKLYNLVSPKSFRVRLLEVILDDPTLKERERKPFYGFLLEEEEQMAKRNNMISIKTKLLRPEVMQREDFLNMAVFNYLIGNTDWSVQYRQNIKFIAKDSLSLPITVPYDFDHAGIVRAPYAKPAEELQMRSTLQRRYRGYCLEDLENFRNVIAKYDILKDDIYGLYSSSSLLDEKYVQKTIKYLDEFYATLHDPKKLSKEFQYPCQKNSTANIVIKGLNN